MTTNCMNHRRKRRQPSIMSRPSRHGAIVIYALVCVAIMAMLMTVVARMSLAQRRLAKRDAWASQAVWLAESAAEKAVAKLKDDPGYEGESWQVPADQLGGADDGLVTIAVEPIPNEGSAYRISLQADYPNDPVHRVRESREFTVSLAGEDSQDNAVPSNSVQEPDDEDK